VSGARGIGIGLLVLAVVIYLLVALPAHDAAVTSAMQMERTRTQAREAAQRLGNLEKRAALLRHAGALIPQGQAATKEPVPLVRSQIVRSLRDGGASHIRLEVRPALPPALAGVSLSAEASFFELLRLLDRVAGPSSGLVLQRVSLTEQGRDIALVLEAQALGSNP
jgi:hypothetical protein